MEGTFVFSEAEKERVLSFQIVRGLNVAKNVHVLVNFLATKEENVIFTTKPTEVAEKLHNE